MKWLRSIHLASVGVFAGAMVMLLVLGNAADPVSPLSFGAVRQAMSIASHTVAVPALLVALLTGLLLLIARPAYIDARWVWGKVAIGLLIGWVAFADVQPAMNRATGFAVQAALGSVIQSGAGAGAMSLGPMEQALQAERRGRTVNLVLIVAATLLSVFKPRLGGTRASARGVLVSRR